MVKRIVNTKIPGTNVRYGNKNVGVKSDVTDVLGEFRFEWDWWVPLDISVQKTNYYFSPGDIIFKLPKGTSWGMSSPFKRMAPFQTFDHYFGLPKTDLPDVGDVIDVVVDVVDDVVEVIDKVCNRWSMNANDQTVKVSDMLDANFKVGLRGLKWECPDNSSLNKDVSGDGFIEIGGKTFPFRIDNGSKDVKLNNFFDFNAVLAGFGVI